MTTNYERAIQNTLLYHQLGKVLSALKREHIPVIILSGAALAETVYPDISQRVMGDVDILIKKDDLDKVNTILVELGYHATLSGEYHYQLKNGYDACPIDIHTEFWYLNEASLTSVWQNARGTIIAGESVLTLPPEETIVYLVADMVFHGWLKPSVLNDFKYLVSRYYQRLNWSTAVNQLQAYRLEIPAYYFFTTARQKVNAEIPVEVIAFLESLPSRFIESMIYQLVLTAPPIRHSGHLLELISIKDKIKYLKSTFLPGRSFLARRYPRNTVPLVLLYPLRAIMHLWRTTKIIVQILIHITLSGFVRLDR